MEISIQHEKVVKYLNKHGQIRLSGIFSDNWGWITYVRSIYDATEITSEWLDYRKEHYNCYGLPDILKESTYSDCIDVYAITKNGKVGISIILWDGNSYDGRRIKKRCMFDVCLPNNLELPSRLVSAIRHHSETFVEHQIKRAEQQRLERLIKKRAKMIFSL